MLSWLLLGWLGWLDVLAVAGLADLGAGLLSWLLLGWRWLVLLAAAGYCWVGWCGGWLLELVVAGLAFDGLAVAGLAVLWAGLVV